MSTPSGELALVYNGEIYNYVELRDELEALGHEFRTDGRHRGGARGLRGVGRATASSGFVGMWAFALLDARARHAVALAATASASSRSTTAPAAAGCYFASEIKALLAAPGRAARAGRGAWCAATC